MKKKKTLKIIAILMALLLLGAAVNFYFGFYGNPVLKWMAGRDIRAYLRDTYPQHPDLEMGEVHYSFKTGRYEAMATLPSEPDIAFDVYWKWGAPIEDDYVLRVTQGQNTLDRLFAEAERRLEAELGDIGELRVFIDQKASLGLPPFPPGTPYAQGLLDYSALTIEQRTSRPGAEHAAELIHQVFSVLKEDIVQIDVMLSEGEGKTIYNVFSVRRDDGLAPDLLEKITSAEELFREDSDKSLRSEGIRVVVFP